MGLDGIETRTTRRGIRDNCTRRARKSPGTSTRHHLRHQQPTFVAVPLYLYPYISVNIYARTIVFSTFFTQ